MFERITTNPRVLHGEPCIRGLRIPVHLVVEMVAAGMTHEDILRNYPDLEPADIQAALDYAARAAGGGLTSNGEKGAVPLLSPPMPLS